jgi:hypothetical protein
MMISCPLPRYHYGFDEGAAEFLVLLRSLKRCRYFDSGYDSYFGKPMEDEASFLDGFRESNQEEDPDFSGYDIHVVGDDADRPNFSVGYSWGTPPTLISIVTMELNLPHPRHGQDIDLFIETVDTIITWKRPQHLRCGPGMYFLNDHPLDKARSGIGWLGWVPFDLSPAQVPEAAIILPMHGGTFVASQREWWIAAGPQRNEAAVQRAQALELRLNHLGVLPTNIELRRGDWGQGTPAR